jgi:hypothetical protein
MRQALLALVVACVAVVGMACGGGNKPPMQPDNDTDSLGDGGPAPAASAPAAH